MQRLLLTAAAAAAIIAACSTPFRAKRTPSGEFCSDMQVVPAGQAPDREYHRLQPIASDPEARTEAERLESLRKAACDVGGDAVIEAVNEELRTEDGRYASVASGTAILWVRRTEGEATPLSVHPTTSPVTSASAAPSAAPPTTTPPDETYDEAAPAASAAPGKGLKAPLPGTASSAKPPGAGPTPFKPQPSTSASAKPWQPPAPASAKPSQPVAPAAGKLPPIKK